MVARRLNFKIRIFLEKSSDFDQNRPTHNTIALRGVVLFYGEKEGRGGLGLCKNERKCGMLAEQKVKKYY